MAAFRGGIQFSLALSLVCELIVQNVVAVFACKRSQEPAKRILSMVIVRLEKIELIKLARFDS